MHIFSVFFFLSNLFLSKLELRYNLTLAFFKFEVIIVLAKSNLQESVYMKNNNDINVNLADLISPLL